MSLPAAALLDVSAVLLVALAANIVLRRQSAALRHWILTVAILGALAAPALELTLPTWTLPAPATQWATTIVAPGTLAVFESIASNGANVSGEMGPIAGSHGVGLKAALLFAWAAGSIGALVFLSTRLIRLKRLVQHVERVDDARWLQLLEATRRTFGVRRRVALLQSEHPAMVVTWGLFRPRVLVPRAARGWTDERLRVVLAHELAHVRRNDWGIQFAASLLQSLYWFHPFVWLAARAVRREAERSCDDLVLETGVSGHEYASHLLAVARAASVRAEPAAAAMARPSTLEERIRAMLNHGLNRQPLTRRRRIASMLLVAGVAMGAATLTIGAAAQSGLGSVSATVYDQAGGILPAVQVSVKQLETGRVYTGATDRAGVYSLRDVASGAYELTMSLPGFATVKAVVDVRPGDRLARSIVLPLGSIEETLTVVGGGSPDAAAPPPRPVRDIPLPRAGTGWSGNIGGSIKVPRKVVDVKPRYPADLEGSGAAATVALSGRIGIDGYVLDLKDVSPTPAHPAFVASANEAARQWEFTPTLLNGAPVETNITITIRYRPE
jgi:beta-lactamase regulating signal transducer with metallopeptidase domain